MLATNIRLLILCLKCSSCCSGFISIWCIQIGRSIIGRQNVGTVSLGHSTTYDTILSLQSNRSFEFVPAGFSCVSVCIRVSGWICIKCYLNVRSVEHKPQNQTLNIAFYCLSHFIIAVLFFFFLFVRLVTANKKSFIVVTNWHVIYPLVTFIHCRLLYCRKIAATLTWDTRDEKYTQTKK